MADGCMVGRWGDINSDCDLTAIDVLNAKLINIGVEMSLAEQCPWAQQQLDPTLDGAPAEGPDVRFLQLVVGNKLRFVTNATSSSATSRWPGMSTSSLCTRTGTTSTPGAV